MSVKKTKRKSSGTNPWGAVLERSQYRVGGQQLNSIAKKRRTFFG
jgi:hypothetical protein